MTPTPLSHAFPKLVAQIDAERPLISAALCDIMVTGIHDQALEVLVTSEHSHALLTSPAQETYLSQVLSQHLNPNSHFHFTLAPAPSPSAEALPKDGPQRNALKFNERSKLSDWMKLPENTDFVAKNTDTTAAGKATHDLGFDISTGNIIGMRVTLGIAKFKPAPTSAQAAQDTDLIALHQQLKEHGLQCEALRIECRTTREAVNLLIAHVKHMQLLLEVNVSANNLRTIPIAAAAEFKFLQPLTPLPEIPETAKAA